MNEMAWGEHRTMTFHYVISTWNPQITSLHDVGNKNALTCHPVSYLNSCQGKGSNVSAVSMVTPVADGEMKMERVQWSKIHTQNETVDEWREMNRRSTIYSYWLHQPDDAAWCVCRSHTTQSSTTSQNPQNTEHYVLHTVYTYSYSFTKVQPRAELSNRWCRQCFNIVNSRWVNRSSYDYDIIIIISYVWSLSNFLMKHVFRWPESIYHYNAVPFSELTFSNGWWHRLSPSSVSECCAVRRHAGWGRCVYQHSMDWMFTDALRAAVRSHQHQHQQRETRSRTRSARLQNTYTASLFTHNGLSQLIIQ